MKEAKIIPVEQWNMEVFWQLQREHALYRLIKVDPRTGEYVFI